MKTSIVVLNWNGWQDTVECLESLFHLHSSDFRVIVCDNGSRDGSLEKIQAWAGGHVLAHCANPALAHLVTPPCQKPVPFRALDRAEAETAKPGNNERLVLIQNGANLGFAGGNNVGLRYALRDPPCQYLWLLNNDTVVEPDALSAVLDYLQSAPGIGLCGTLQRSYYDPAEVQVFGGRFLQCWTGRTYKNSALDARAANRPPFDYVEGSSMIATRDFVETVGLLEESYFLYFEELDWAMRARGKLALGYAPQSVIYHKEGASIGSHADRTRRSLLSEQYLSQSRVRFMRRFLPWALPTTIIALCLSALHRVLQGDRRRAATILAGALRGLVSTTEASCRTGLNHDCGNPTPSD